ncbi:polysaccharide deacetylase family protein [Sphaerotilus mobilis]|uniref:Peptidoglycan/xylan/chitin deacetylase (PgdA/CDA1 family) n=1 Tax=Sphaerotilus mobilis TaxID=47994 RepID=A0A4Q7LBZ0_9BURK|nr:polysaccharide deacetylase family protein [Sphaerotilus mobilis]RZS51886.1 peptidoglycan/xylan/chitin deacetylase (PgdA/CDA1 family) [Sphaerotilus mobilis]
MNTAAAITPAARWSWPPLLRASVVLHVLVLLTMLVWPLLWPWALALLVANHAVIVLGGLWPRADWLGPNLLRLPAAAAARGEVALTIDDGPDPVLTPAVLDLLDAAGARATFFCIAERAERHPELVRDIIQRGHSVQNHSLRHRHTFSLLGPRGYARELAASQAVLTRLTGQVPRYFRAPAGLRNPFLDPVLHRLGLTLASWTRRGFDTRERDPHRVLARLSRGLAGGDILLLHDGHAARTAEGTPVVLAVLPPLLALLRERGLSAVTLSQACLERDPNPPTR